MTWREILLHRNHAIVARARGRKRRYVTRNFRKAMEKQRQQKKIIDHAQHRNGEIKGLDCEEPQNEGYR